MSDNLTGMNRIDRIRKNYNKKILCILYIPVKS